MLHQKFPDMKMNILINQSPEHKAALLSCRNVPGTYLE